MKEYEIVHEIFNECANNQMRDVFFEEAEVEDPESYVRARHKDKELHLEKTVQADGSVVIDIESAGLLQRYFLHGNLSKRKRPLRP